MVNARLFVQGNLAYAWISADMKIDDWDFERVSTRAPYGSESWHASAFEACTTAFRRLQRKHPEMDIVVSLDDPPGLHSFGNRGKQRDYP